MEIPIPGTDNSSFDDIVFVCTWKCKVLQLFLQPFLSGLVMLQIHRNYNWLHYRSTQYALHSLQSGGRSIQVFVQFSSRCSVITKIFMPLVNPGERLKINSPRQKVNWSILKITITLDRLRWYEKVERHFYCPQSLRKLCFYTCLSVILHPGGLHGGSASRGGWTDLPPSDTTRYGQRAGGTHNTVMHSC